MTRIISRTAPIGAGRLRAVGGAGEGFVAVGQLLVEDAEGAKVGQGLPGGFFVDPGEGKADVDDGVVADLDLGHVVEADVFDDAAEIDAAHTNRAVGGDLFDFSRNRETHSNLVIPDGGGGQM
jgi:hypothetical protein